MRNVVRKKKNAFDLLSKKMRSVVLMRRLAGRKKLKRLQSASKKKKRGS